MRHMAANFYERFKNKDLMNFFKRLCTQNQQRKFDALWGIIDDISPELLKSQTSSSSRRSSTDSLVRAAKPFTQWIDGAHKEKWSLLYDTDGRRYGIETTNHAECYNMVIRHVRGFPLVGSVEFIMYGCVRYFRERYASATSLLHDPGVRFCGNVNEYMEKRWKRFDFT